MQPKELNNLFFKNKLDKENNKEIILIRDFNIDLIETNTNKNASGFLDKFTLKSS